MKQLSNPRRYVKWKKFDDFIQSEWTVWKLVFIHNGWKTSICTCPSFQKHYVCKHLIAIASNRNQLKFLNAVKDDEVPIGQTRKRGRPKIATKALIL